MKIKLNFPKDKTNFETNLAYFKAYLMQHYIDNLNICDNEKKQDKEALIEKLQNTCTTDNWALGLYKRKYKKEKTLFFPLIGSGGYLK